MKKQDLEIGKRYTWTSDARSRYTQSNKRLRLDGFTTWHSYEKKRGTATWCTVEHLQADGTWLEYKQQKIGTLYIGEPWEDYDRRKQEREARVAEAQRERDALVARKRKAHYHLKRLAGLEVELDRWRLESIGPLPLEVEDVERLLVFCGYDLEDLPEVSTEQALAAQK